MQSKIYLACLIISLILAIIFLGLGIGGYFYVRHLIVDGVLDHSLVRENTEGADNFAKNYGDGRASTYLSYHMWNLTNYEDVMRGKATPHFVEIGPYVYQKKTRRVDAEWHDGGDLVDFIEFDEHVFIPEMSGSNLSQDDIIVNINQVYAGGLLLASGNEQNLLSLLSGSYLEVVINKYFLSEAYIQGTISAFRGAVLASALEQIREYYPNPSDEVFILELLGNASSADACGKYFEARTCTPLFDGLTTGAGLSMVQAEKMVDSNGAFSIYNPTSKESATTWTKYCYEGDLSALSLLSSYLDDASQSTIDSICQWMKVVDGTRVSDFIVWEYGIEHVREIGYVEWGSGRLSNITNDDEDDDEDDGNDGDLTLSYGELMRKLSIDPELFSISVETCKRIFRRDGGFYDQDTWMGFLVGYMMMGPSVGAQFGLTEDQTTLFMVHYIQGMMVPYAVPTLMGMDKTSGLFVHRSVREWLYQCYDQALGASCNLCTSQTETEALSFNKRSALWTGKGSYDECESYQIYNGTEILEVWSKPVPVYGTDGTQFRPFLQSVDWTPERVDGYKTLFAFIPDLSRSLELRYEEDVEYKDIDLWRYRIASDMLSPSEMYNIHMQGVMNMTSVVGSTIMMSKPHFLDADVSAYKNISGMTPNRELHDTMIDVEPYTGSVFRGHKRLQVSVSLPDWWSLSLPSHSETPRVLYPLVWFDIEGSATDEQASKMRDKVYGSILLMKITLVSGIALSVVAIIAFTVSLCIHKRRNSTKGQHAKYFEIA
eukprot:TRINITY_DN2686_c1_g1_i1.p1 TRINITY_DN2686_c1_g1~~TRINITY_DN2686_c1_g1_i1.p1  ORF type:complete len:771 (-),score=199.28 TRINITY_DN2686_c1_g1_i1:194-2506(-)